MAYDKHRCWRLEIVKLLANKHVVGRDERGAERLVDSANNTFSVMAAAANLGCVMSRPDESIGASLRHSRMTSRTSRSKAP